MILSLHSGSSSGLSCLVQFHLTVVQLNSWKAVRLRLAQGFHLHCGDGRHSPPINGMLHSIRLVCILVVCFLVAVAMDILLHLSYRHGDR